MNEAKTTLRRMALYYLLLLIHIIPSSGLIPDVFPVRNASTVYLLILSVCLILYYRHRVTPAGTLSVMMKALSWMSLLMILLRGIKYSAFAGVGVLARHTWYLYYVPLLLLPLLLFYISLLVSTKEHSRLSGGWYWAAAVTAVLIVLILTNDLHQLMFRFRPGFVDWDSEYSRGWLFYLVYVWQYALYFAAIIILVVKSRISSSRKNAWLILIPFVTGIAMNVLLLTETMPHIGNSYFIEFPETLIFTAAVMLECCMQLGLIPTNSDYGRLFRHFSIRAQITDHVGTPVYVSGMSAPLTPDQFALPDGARIDAHTVLHRMELPGGFGFWQDDMTQLDRLNDELEEAREGLKQEAELTRLRNELKEKQTSIEQRTAVYDTVAERTGRQSQLLSQLAREARLSSDPEVKDGYRNRITLLGAYIKRYANLTLLSQEDKTVEAGELALSVSEVLRYLNYCGIPGEIIHSADCKVPSDAAITVFESFETLLELHYEQLKGVFVNLSDSEKLLFKLTLENITQSLPADLLRRLLSVGVMSDVRHEDDVTYICLSLPKGGDAA